MPTGQRAVARRLTILMSSISFFTSAQYLSSISFPADGSIFSASAFEEFMMNSARNRRFYLEHKARILSENASKIFTTILLYSCSKQSTQINKSKSFHFHQIAHIERENNCTLFVFTKARTNDYS